MIAAAVALLAGTVPPGTIPVQAVVDSIRCDWRDANATGRATLTLALADGAVPIEGETTGGEARTVSIRLDAGEDLDCRPESRLAAPAVPPAGGTGGWFVLARLADGRVTAVVTDRTGGAAQGFAIDAVRNDGLRVKRVVAIRRKRCVGRPGEQVCY